MNLQNYYWYFESALPSRLCDDIVKYGLEHQDVVAVTQGDKDLKNIQRKRKSNIVWMSDKWIYKEIQPYVQTANENAGWNYQWDWTESCQFTKYNIGQYYGWHIDSFDKPNDGDDPIQKGKIRKLSMTISLNDGTEYDGGQLQFDYKNVSFDEWTNEKIESSKSLVIKFLKKVPLLFSLHIFGIE